jgi:hypothetical protein
MADMGSGGANRIELESQILCASLRQSWAMTDVEGMITAARQLYQLFPDLLPPLKSDNGHQPVNLYDFLGVTTDSPQTAVLAAYLRAVKKFLRENSAKDNRDAYFMYLNAGYVLRKPRLRLSHDLVVVRHFLIEKKAIPEDGTIDFVEPPQKAVAEAPQLVTTQQVAPLLPTLVELLKQAQIIGAAEVQALVNQMSLAPEIPVQELILSAGYVTDLELKSLQLAEYLLSQGKIDMGQFAVAMYDERTSGVRMAESLQNRGWLETQVKQFTDEAK